MNAIRVGSYVTHSQRPAWGLGKVFGQSSSHVLVGFAGLPEEERFKRLEMRIGLLHRATVNGDAQLDSWNVQCDSTCHYIAAVEKPKRHGKTVRWTRTDAMERFVNKFTGGFPDAWYRSTSRADHVARHDKWTELLPGARLRELADTDPLIGGQAIVTALTVSARPLLTNGGELPQLQESFKSNVGSRALLIALADLLDADRPTADLFDGYVAAFESLRPVGRKRPVSWSLISALPFVAQPSRHIHVRPPQMRKAAAGMGFDLKFHERPSFKTYDSILVYATDLLAFVKPRGGVDMIDVLALINTTVE
jgi:hypothetical protein